MAGTIQTSLPPVTTTRTSQLCPRYDAELRMARLLKRVLAGGRKWSHFCLLLLVSTIFPYLAVHGEDAPDPASILKKVRAFQAGPSIVFTGQLRTGGNSVPFIFKRDGNVLRFDFTAAPQSVIVQFDENNIRVERIDKGGRETVRGARFIEKLHGTGVSYEDLSMRFLYWPDAAIEKEDTAYLQRCWVIVVQVPADEQSEYGKAKLWIAQSSSALLKVEAYDRSLRLRRKIVVVSMQDDGTGARIFKQLRIETGPSDAGTDRKPTYVEIEKK